jgi:hypothetical protein
MVGTGRHKIGISRLMASDTCTCLLKVLKTWLRLL